MEPNELMASLLNDPAAMQKLMHMASELMGSTPNAANTSDPPSDPQTAAQPRPSMPPTVPNIPPMPPSMPETPDSARLQLLTALKPFLSASAGEQIDHATRLLSMARMAKTAAGQILPHGTQEV